MAASDPGRDVPGLGVLPIPATLTETAEPPVAPSEFEVEAKKRISLLDAIPKNPAETKAEGQPKDEKADRGSPEGAGAEKPVEQGKTPATATVPTEELRFVPEQHRKFFETAPSDVVKWLSSLNDGNMKDADYRQKTAEVATKRKFAEFGENIASDPDAMAVLREYASGKRGGTKPDAQPRQPFNHVDATPEEFDTFLAERDKRLREEIRAELSGEREAETQAQRELREMGLAAKAEFVDSGEYSVAEVDAAYDRLVKKGVKFSKDDVVENLRMVLPKREKPAPKVDETASGANGKTSAAASVLSRAAGASSPVTTPAFAREHRAPKNLEERIQEAEWLAKQKQWRRTGSRTS